jgi:putative SOS response-associated peptidase YedK
LQSITADSKIHDRMPVILPASGYVRWLGEEEDPRELMRPFPSEAMRMWPISTRVNKPENDDPSILAKQRRPPGSAGVAVAV